MRETSGSATPHNRVGGVHGVQIAARKMLVGRQIDFLAGTAAASAQQNQPSWTEAMSGSSPDASFG